MSEEILKKLFKDYPSFSDEQKLEAKMEYADFQKSQQLGTSEKTEIREFVVNQNRAKIDLKVIIVDFDSVTNLDIFVSTISKILIANKHLSNAGLATASNMVNFSSTYEKSRRNHKNLGSLFQLVEEGNNKTISGGIFGFQERLKMFLDDETKHSTSFDSFLKKKNIDMSELYSLSKSDIEDLVTLTSSCGIARTGISLREKNVGLYRFDDLKPVTVRYDPTNGVEPWRKRFNSDFVQLSGRIACLGQNVDKDNLKRCAILARATRQASQTTEDSGIVTWLDCLLLFLKIPSIEVSEQIVFCSYNKENFIKDDLTFQKNPAYHSRIKQVNKDSLLDEILFHLNLSSFEMRENEEVTNDIAVQKGVEIISLHLRNFLEKIEREYGIDTNKFNISVIWSTNSSHLFSGLTISSILKNLEDISVSFKQKGLPREKFSDYLFEKWLKIYNGSKKQKIIGISVERSCFEPNKKNLKSFLTDKQLKKVQEKIKNKNSMKNQDKIVCESFESFVENFKLIFDRPGRQIILAPVRCGKTYACEKYIVEELQKEGKKILVFITEKNILAECSHSNILTLLGDENPLKNNAFIFTHETSTTSLKNLKDFFAKDSKNSVSVLSSFAYFTGDQQSPLFKTIILARQQGYEVTFLVDEAESLFNSLQLEVILERPQDKLFKTPAKGNGLSAIDSSKCELLMNFDVQPEKNQNLIKGRISAMPGNIQNFEYFYFSPYNVNTNDLLLYLYTKEPIFSESIVFCKIEKVSICNDLFITKDNIEGIVDICDFRENEVTFNDSIFEIIETLHEKGSFSCFYTLVAVIHNVLRSSSFYVRYYSISAKEDTQKALSYDEACRLYSIFKAAKSSSGSANVKATDYFSYPKIGKLYQFELIFNKNYPIRVIESHSDKVIYLSGTWNEWLINSTYYPDLISSKISGKIDDILRLDLIKLTSLVAAPASEGLSKATYPAFFKMSRLSFRFTKFSTLREKAEKLNL